MNYLVQDPRFPRLTSFLLIQVVLTHRKHTFSSNTYSTNVRNFSNKTAGGQIHSLKCINISVITMFKITYLSSSCKQAKRKSQGTRATITTTTVTKTFLRQKLPCERKQTGSYCREICTVKSV